jgi:flagellar basal-body rod modification protein FlgD
MSGNIVSSAAGSSPPSTSAIAQTGTTALGSLNTNFSTFLTLLTTQLKNQDPSSPMDSNQFTTELVQFSSVEQQINTNSSLTQLIQLTQASQIEQSSSMIGKPVTVNSSQLSLQGGLATVNFNTPTAQPVTVSIYGANGSEVQSATLKTASGANSWQWDGKGAGGSVMPDGPYKVSISTLGTGGPATQVPFTVTGTTTAVQSSNGSVQLQMGGLTVPFSAVTSVGK